MLELRLALSLLEIFKNCNRNRLLVPFFFRRAMGSHSWHLRGVALGVQPITIPNDQQAAMSKHQQWLLSYVACCGHGVECALRCESMIWKFAQTSNPRSMDCSPHLPYTDYACKKQFFHSLYSCSGRGQLPGSILAVSSVSKAPNDRGFPKQCC